MSTTRPTDTKSLLARLPGTESFELTLTNRSMVSPSLVELTLQGIPSTVVFEPGQDLMLAVPVEGGDGSFRRRYTVRRQRSESGEIDLWVDTLAGGPGATWAKTAPVGSHIEGLGPRGKVLLDPMADWHLFVGDLSFLSAAYAMAEGIDPPGQVLFLFEIESDDDAVTPTLGDDLAITLCYVERSDRALNDPSGLLAGLAALEFPEDDGHVYVGGELSVVAKLRAALVERGLTPEQINAKSYWRLGVSNAAHGEPKKDEA